MRNGIRSVQRDEVPEIRLFTNYWLGWVG